MITQITVPGAHPAESDVNYFLKEFLLPGNIVHSEVWSLSGYTIQYRQGLESLNDIQIFQIQVCLLCKLLHVLSISKAFH